MLPSRIRAAGLARRAARRLAGRRSAGHSRRAGAHSIAYCRRAVHRSRDPGAYFSTNALEFDFSLDAPEPTLWLDFLTQLFGDDIESIETLQEWFGYLLTPDTRQQKIFMLIGPPRSGKGTIARVLESLIGRANVAGPTLASFEAPSACRRCWARAWPSLPTRGRGAVSINTRWSSGCCPSRGRIRSPPIENTASL